MGKDVDDIGLSSSTACCKLTGHMQTTRIHFVLSHRITLGNLFTALVALDGFPPTHKSCRVMICVSVLSHHSGVCLVLCCSVAIPLLVTQNTCLCVCVRCHERPETENFDFSATRLLQVCSLAHRCRCVLSLWVCDALHFSP